MSGILYDANNVVVGNAVLRLAPWVLGSVQANVADTVPLFSTDILKWPDPWFSAGATDEGFKLAVDTSTTTVTIEEQATPVGETVEGKNITIQAALAEDTLQSMRMSWGGSAIVIAPAASGVPGTQKMTLTSNTNYYTAILEMANKYGLARRIYIPKVSVSGSGDTAFRRAADKRLYPLAVASICAPSEIQIVDVTAPALP